MQAFIIAPLGYNDETFSHTVQHVKTIETNLKAIFAKTDPDFSIKVWYTNDEKNIESLCVSLVAMKSSAVVYFCKGWEKYKESKTLHYICEVYEIQRMEE